MFMIVIYLINDVPVISHVLKCIEQHHINERPRQGICNVIPLSFAYPEKQAAPEKIRCKSSLGGLLNHYYIDKEAA